MNSIKYLLCTILTVIALQGKSIAQEKKRPKTIQLEILAHLNKPGTYAFRLTNNTAKAIEVDPLGVNSNTLKLQKPDGKELDLTTSRERTKKVEIAPGKSFVWDVKLEDLVLDLYAKDNGVYRLSWLLRTGKGKTHETSPLLVLKK